MSRDGSFYAGYEAGAEKFCKEFNMSDEQFRNSRLNWEELKKIADDFDLKKNEHQNTVKQYAEMVRKCSYVHSLNYRVKKGCDEKYIYVNERFALTILLQAITLNTGTRIPKP